MKKKTTKPDETPPDLSIADCAKVLGGILHDDQLPTYVIYRRDTDEGGDIVACFPKKLNPLMEVNPECSGVCYAHVGQHSEYARHAMEKTTRSVDMNDPEDAKDVAKLEAELKSIGYKNLIHRTRGL